MKWNFLGFHNWPPASGQLDLLQGMDVFRAAETRRLPREMCEGCICWREFGTCAQVQVDDWEADREQRNAGGGDYSDITDCLVSCNCCPILFFDFIGIKLPELEATS